MRYFKDLYPIKKRVLADRLIRGRFNCSGRCQCLSMFQISGFKWWMPTVYITGGGNFHSCLALAQKRQISSFNWRSETTTEVIFFLHSKSVFWICLVCHPAAVFLTKQKCSQCKLRFSQATVSEYKSQYCYNICACKSVLLYCTIPWCFGTVNHICNKSWGGHPLVPCSSLISSESWL